MQAYAELRELPIAGSQRIDYAENMVQQPQPWKRLGRGLYCSWVVHSSRWRRSPHHRRRRSATSAS